MVNNTLDHLNEFMNMEKGKMSSAQLTSHQSQEELYLQVAQDILQQSKNSFKNYNTKEKLISALKRTIEAKNYYIEQKEIYLYQAYQYKSQMHSLKLEANSAKSMADILENLQDQLAYKIITFSSLGS